VTTPASLVPLTTAPGDEHGREILRTWLRLLTCTNTIEARVRTMLRERFDSTLPRFDLLVQLDAAASESVHGLTMSELSRRLMVTNGNLTGLVDRLARERLVSRAVSPDDRRTQVVRLTTAGKRALDEMIPEHQSWVSDMFSGLSESERAQLYTLLGKLKSSAQRVGTGETRSDA
jgi:DNA-binding MarR family transcriptional regulator